jgi:hypothetical protein
VRKILEKRWEFSKGTCLAFIDVEKACGSINRQEIWKTLCKANVFKGPVERMKIVKSKV